MKKRIFSSIFLVALALIIFITAIVTATYYIYYSEEEINRLKEESQLVIKGVELNGISYFDSMAFDNYRITWIESDGTILYDSASDSSSLENHLEREEVKEALETGYGESKRYSKTILQESFYVAYKISDGTVIRLSCTQGSIFSLIVTTLYPLYYVAFISLIVSILLAFALSRKILDPLNGLDLENIDANTAYPEVRPLLNRINVQRTELLNDKKEIQKTSEIRQEFTANVTHEMKTPLHVISGYSELMMEGMSKESDVKEFSKKINLESHRLTKLVDDILELSKLDHGTLDEEKKMISLDSISKNVIDSLESVASEKQISLKANLSPVETLGSPSIIHSLVYNLVENAIKYNRENGEVDIHVAYEGTIPTLTITDTGIGIPEDKLDRIYERFYRVDKSHSREMGGTGLGLSIVKHAALVHNAKIDVKSTLGEGTTFKISF